MHLRKSLGRQRAWCSRPTLFLVLALARSHRLPSPFPSLPLSLPYSLPLPLHLLNPAASRVPADAKSFVRAAESCGEALSHGRLRREHLDAESVGRRRQPPLLPAARVEARGQARGGGGAGRGGRAGLCSVHGGQGGGGGARAAEEPGRRRGGVGGGGRLGGRARAAPVRPLPSRPTHVRSSAARY
eukprot:1063848-Rhodomonas_salina.1